jgi:hypothetical protein
MRKVDLYAHSNGFAGLHSASLGGSYIKIQLLDTLRLDEDQDKLLPFAYTIGLSTAVKPAHLGFEGRMFLQEVSGNFSFKDEILGNELTINRIYLFHLGEKQYEILVNGLYNDRTYNFHYSGPIHLQNEVPEWDVTR